MLHLEVFSSSIATGTTPPLQVSAIKSQIVPLDGSGLGFLLQSLSKVMLVAHQGTHAIRAQLQSPTLRKQPFIDIVPVNRLALFDSPVRIADFSANPLQLSPSEALTCFATQNAGAGEVESVGVWLTDGPRVPRLGPPPLVVHATAAVVLAALAWSTVSFNLDTQLDPGTYAIIGMRAFSATGLFARVIPNSGNQNMRPGVTMIQAYGGLDMKYARNGELGTFVTFVTTNLPQFELFATSADTAEELWLDLVQLSPSIQG
jgi:hypothetical protein